MAEPQDKYKMFRNFMTNELGIGRDDIQAWTKEAVQVEARRAVAQMNVEAAVEAAVRAAIKGTSYSHSGMSEDLKKIVQAAVAAEITGRIKFVEPSNG